MATLRSKEILFLMYIPSWQGNASLLQGSPGPVGVTQSIVRVKNGYAQSKKRPLWVERSFSPPHFHHSLQTDHTPGCEFLHLLRLKKKLLWKSSTFFRFPGIHLWILKTTHWKTALALSTLFPHPELIFLGVHSGQSSDATITSACTPVGRSKTANEKPAGVEWQIPCVQKIGAWGHKEIHQPRNAGCLWPYGLVLLAAGMSSNA